MVETVLKNGEARGNDTYILSVLGHIFFAYQLWRGQSMSKMKIYNMIPGRLINEEDIMKRISELIDSVEFDKNFMLCI